MGAATATAAMAGGGLRGVAIASVMASTIGPLLGGALLTPRVHRSSLHLRRSEVIGILRYGGTIGALNATGVLHRTVDRLVVGGVFGPAAVTLVEIATQVQNGVSASLGAAAYAATSSASWVRSRGDPKILRELLIRGTRYSSAMVLVLAVETMVLARPLVRVWVGPRYDDVAGLIVLAVLYLVMQTPLQVGSNVLQGVGRGGTIVVPALAAVTVNLIGSILLVHAFGVAGTFVATLIAGVVLTPPLLSAMLRETTVSLREFMGEAVVPALAPAAATAVATLAIVALPLHDLATLVGGAATGLVAGLVVGARTMRPGELRDLREALRRQP